MSCSTPEPFVPLPTVKHHVILIIGCSFAMMLESSKHILLLLAVTFALSLFIPYCFRTTDHAEERRRLFEEFKKRPDPMIGKVLAVPDEVHLEERYWINSRGMALATSIMTPKNEKPQAIIFFCHGYTDDATFLNRYNHFRFVQAGLAVATIEYEGHGRSDGPLGLIYDFDRTVQDTVDYFREVSCQERFIGKKRFLFGVSMGGAVSYLAYQKMPALFDGGVVFVSPMCKISDAIKPPKWIIDLLLRLTGPLGCNRYLGYLPIAPTNQDMEALTHRDAIMKNLGQASPFTYGRSPRLTTARELLFATSKISSSMGSFDAPFLVQHGKDDKVTDPNLSRALYEEAKSNDKSIKLYPGMYHAIITDVPADTEIVLNDSIQWIMKRA